MTNQILDILSQCDCDNIDWVRGFKAAIQIANAIESVNDRKIEQLEQDITMLRVRVAQLESHKYIQTPYPWYTGPSSNGIAYIDTLTTSGTKIIK